MPEKPIGWLWTTPPVFPIVVPQPEGYHPAGLWCLIQEGHTGIITRQTDDGYAYGDLVADQWQTGQGFVIVEHDICPWWGALRELWECEQDWCVFPYPQGRGWPDPALGCSKYSARLVQAFPDMWRHLRASTWLQVQETIMPTLWNAGWQWHEHWPPVAHARQRFEYP